MVMTAGSMEGDTTEMPVEAMERMIQDIESEVVLTRSMTGMGALSPEVMAALHTVPRHMFVHSDQQPFAYENHPLPIGEGQTISQPYIVALMTDVVRHGKGDVVLEVGTGSGYQAAVLSRLVKKVYSIEIVPSLARQAGERLRALHYDNVEIRVGDGYYGWEEHAPYDAILVTAAATHIPGALIRQLRPGGRMVIPVGNSPLGGQGLVLVEKRSAGDVTLKNILPVAFVPLTGEGHEINPGRCGGL